ncbi:MAG: secondary thiamine-phosphate synthase enzyme YjbQ [Pyrinomonadaceae bacterium]
MYVLKVRSREREQFVEITAEVRRRLKESGALEGLCVLYVQHTTAGLTVNENADPDVQRDMLLALRTLVPQHGMDFRHNEENSDAHIKASLFGTSVTIPFSGRRATAGPLARHLPLRVRRRARAASDYDDQVSVV